MLRALIEGMRMIALLSWGAGTFYATLCAFLCLRCAPACTGVASGRGGRNRPGYFTRVGVAMFFWLPRLTYAAIVRELLHERYMLAVYLAAILGVVVAAAGSWGDIAA